MKLLGLAPYLDETDGKAKLKASRCRKCGHISCPPMSFHCLEATELVLVKASGRVESHTVVHVAPPRFSTPYVIGYLRLDEGPRIVTRLAKIPTNTSATWEPELGVIGKSGQDELVGLIFDVRHEFGEGRNHE